MRSSSFSRFSFTAALVLLLAGTRMYAKKVIVDDADNRITYSWLWVYGQSCTNCSASVGAQPETLNRTWHYGWRDTSDADNLYFTFNFTGTAVELIYVATDIIQTGYITGTNATYSIDGMQRGTAVRNPTNLDAYAYNQSLFNVTGLENTQHTLKVTLLSYSALLLDYLVYDDGVVSDHDNKPSSKLGPIIGGIVGGLLVLVFMIWLLCKHGSTNTPNMSEVPLQPSDSDSGTQPPTSTPRKSGWAAALSSRRLSRFPLL